MVNPDLYHTRHIVYHILFRTTPNVTWTHTYHTMIDTTHFTMQHYTRNTVRISRWVRNHTIPYRDHSIHPTFIPYGIISYSQQDTHGSLGQWHLVVIPSSSFPRVGNASFPFVWQSRHRLTSLLRSTSHPKQCMYALNSSHLRGSHMT